MGVKAILLASLLSGSQVRCRPVACPGHVILTKRAWEACRLSWSYILMRSGLAVLALSLLYLSQRFWYRALWRVTSNWGRVGLRTGVRFLYLTGLILFIVTI